MIKLILKIKDTKNSLEFNFESDYKWHTLNFWNEFIDYRSWSVEDNVSFEMTINNKNYTPKHIREVTQIRDVYIKKCKKVKRKLLNDSDVPWIDFE